MRVMMMMMRSTATNDSGYPISFRFICSNCNKNMWIWIIVEQDNKTQACTYTAALKECWCTMDNTKPFAVFSGKGKFRKPFAAFGERNRFECRMGPQIGHVQRNQGWCLRRWQDWHQPLSKRPCRTYWRQSSVLCLFVSVLFICFCQFGSIRKSSYSRSSIATWEIDTFEIVIAMRDFRNSGISGVLLFPVRLTAH